MNWRGPSKMQLREMLAEALRNTEAKKAKAAAPAEQPVVPPSSAPASVPVPVSSDTFRIGDVVHVDDVWCWIVPAPDRDFFHRWTGEGVIDMIKYDCIRVVADSDAKKGTWIYGKPTWDHGNTYDKVRLVGRRQLDTFKRT